MNSNKPGWDQYPVTAFHIDDQRSVTTAMRHILDDVPFLSLHTTNHPEHAIQEILKIGPTVILLDIHMPMLDGYGILKQLQDSEVTQNIPVIMLSVDTSAKSKQQAFHLGAHDYLIKIPAKDELVLRLRYHSKAYIHHLERDAAIIALEESKQKLQESLLKLKQNSHQDEITHIANSRSFDDYFAREWQRSLRETSALSLVFIDLDFFEQYNNFYGQTAGNDCLKEVAQALHHTLKRPTDFLARYKGVSFALLLPNTHGQGAMLIAEKLRKVITALSLEHQQSTAFGLVTASLGVVTTSPQIKHHSRDFLHMAGKALSIAKQNGRNQVICKSI